MNLKRSAGTLARLALAGSIAAVVHSVGVTWLWWLLVASPLISVVGMLAVVFTDGDLAADARLCPPQERDRDQLAVQHGEGEGDLPLLVKAS